MKRLTIKKSLERYDSNKGYGRTLIKEEPHIKELRAFYKDLKEENLSSSSLLKLAQILIGKNTRTHTQESGKTFEELVVKLGGYEALDTLDAAGQLNEENVAFLERHPSEAVELAHLILSISKKVPTPDIKDLFSAAEKLDNPKQLMYVFKIIEQCTRTPSGAALYNILTLLNQHGLNSDEVLPILEAKRILDEVESAIKINQILLALAAKDSSLMTLHNLTHILQLENYPIFYELLVLLPLNQKTLESFFQAKDTWENNYWTKHIITNFNKAGWDVTPFLDVLLREEINDWELKEATAKLSQLKVKPEFISLILQTIFLHSNESAALIDAVEILSKENGNEDFLKVSFAIPKYSNLIAQALVILREANLYHETTRVYACTRPEYAPGLAQFWIQSSKIQCNPELRAMMLKYPQCASFTADVIDFLRKKNLAHEKNINAVCKAQLNNDALFNLLALMSEANILDQKTLDVLLSQLSLIKTLYSGAKCLANVDKLDAANFDLIVSNPINALEIAEVLGGTPSPKEYSFIKNPGAQDFATIRRNTKILCQGHRQGLFFQEMSSIQKQSFEKQRKITPAKAQEDIILKIAQYTGDGNLEEQTEHNIAQQTYSSFF
ncbi:Uncharacterised protein [Legionella wadsworthii]|uniref:Uncharacterized protein n=1 Tax=Legionella wadsworthii TaxID=28088 RepID=A0A378LR55_9GAMM|nr:hypothetical protein [Legionella wadsworthii]STY28850.1 Uncharacterised protein [Legionella wadsworthii]